MNWYKPTKWMWITGLALICSACTTVDDGRPVVDTNVKISFPAIDPVTNVDQADEVLAAVALSKAQIDWRYHQKEQICFTWFFMNHCLLEAKDERRTDLAVVKKSEVAANYFKRRDNVEEMDRSLVEKNRSNPLPDPDSKDESAANTPATDTTSAKTPATSEIPASAESDPKMEQH